MTVLKKIIYLFLSLVFLLSFASCGEKPKTDNSSSETVSSTESASTVTSDTSTVEDSSVNTTVSEASSVVSSTKSKSTSSKKTVSKPKKKTTKKPEKTKKDEKINVKPSKPATQTQISIPAFSAEVNKKIAKLSKKRIGFSWAYPESDKVLNKYNAYSHGYSNSKIIYLTFDEGYEYKNQTAKILDILKKKQVKAVFFVTLSYVKENPKLVKRMIKEGHAVGNHTVNHPEMTDVSLKRAYKEIKELHDYMLQKYNYSMSLFRFPCGTYNHQLLEMVNQMGYKSVFWNFAYEDWETNKQPSVSSARKKVLSYAKKDALYLLHACSSTNVKILPDLIDGARKKGLTFEVFG